MTGDHCRNQEIRSTSKSILKFIYDLTGAKNNPSHIIHIGMYPPMHFSPSPPAPLHSNYLSTLNFKKTNLGSCCLFCFPTCFPPIISSSRLPAHGVWWVRNVCIHMGTDTDHFRKPGHVFGGDVKIKPFGPHSIISPL